ncbi:MAG: type II secretion system protein M [Blastocatellia bacterium]|nr:type II secretion system protein M [Blastocatellia bacterium]MCS7157615.1 type II secretion system protein M [Blastocatellia bacterium]MCX7751880.1 type II secretion system protein M [Blastocatellia bacterium]MDW8166986.1 GspMb/PilO family protein [Acidobacteriota bacterium]MDW8257090.1 GspMb/PilO family protein [Acidobacteriota bacterium]
MSAATFVFRNGRLWRAKRLGAIEGFLLLGALAAIATVGAFFWSLERHQQRVAELERRFRENQEMIALLRQRVAAAQAGSRTEAPTPEAVRRSLHRFEHTYLPDSDTGLSRVLTEVNRIAQESGVLLSSDIMFNPMEEAEFRAGTGTAARMGGRGFYPGLRLSFTVSGEYASMRRFLAALERSPLLLIVESLALKSVEERATARPAAASGGSVSLEITISAYFRRSGGES